MHRICKAPVRPRSAFAVAVLLAALGSVDVSAQSRQAQCLLEVKGVHYLGGPCIFQALDRRGSFRITDVQGLNLIAQINATKKDEGKAVWNGPLGGSASGHVIGDASRDGACWMLNDSSSSDYDDSRICSWNLNERVYLGPSPGKPSPTNTLFYGSRVGMYDDITSRSGLDTSGAQVITTPSKDGAVKFCREYSRDYSIQCVNDILRNSSRSAFKGDCKAKTFSTSDGHKYAFGGKAPKNDDTITADYIIKDLADGTVLDGSSASGYDVRLGIYKALCPSSAPKRTD